MSELVGPPIGLMGGQQMERWQGPDRLAFEAWQKKARDAARQIAAAQQGPPAPGSVTSADTVQMFTDWADQAAELARQSRSRQRGGGSVTPSVPTLRPGSEARTEHFREPAFDPRAPFTGSRADPLPGHTYRQRFVKAMADLKEKRKSRDPLTDEKRQDWTKRILANRARRREVEGERRANRSKRIPLHIQYALMQQAARPQMGMGNMSPRDMIAMMGVQQRAQQANLANQLAAAGLQQGNQQFQQQMGFDARMRGDEMAARAARSADELNFRQSQAEENARLRELEANNRLLMSDSPYAANAASPAQKAAKDDADMQNLLVLIRRGLQGRGTGEIQNPGDAENAAFEAGMTEEQIQELYDSTRGVGRGAVVGDPAGWSYKNFTGPTGLPGLGGIPFAKSPRGASIFTPDFWSQWWNDK